MTTIRFITRTRKNRIWIVHGLRALSRHADGTLYGFDRGGREYTIGTDGTIHVLTKRGTYSRIGTGAEVQP